MRRRRAGLVRLLRDVVSPNGWKPAHERRGADTRVRSQAPLVISGVASAFVGDGQNAVVPGVRDGWSPLVDVFFKC